MMNLILLKIMIFIKYNLIKLKNLIKEDNYIETSIQIKIFIKKIKIKFKTKSHFLLEKIINVTDPIRCPIAQ